MPAELIPAPDRDQPHLLRLPSWAEAGELEAAIRDALLLAPHLKGPVTLISGVWPLRLADYQCVIRLLEARALCLVRVCAEEEGAMVAAAALGLVVDVGGSRRHGEKQHERSPCLEQSLVIHQGTLRSGDRTHAAGSLLILGDVNPGAQVSAEGHLMVWGRLRGMAHAGCSGNREATIVAFHLHPLQLRIADLVARGPLEAPPPGLAEKAHLVDGRIQIDPADPQWPLRVVPAPLPGLAEARRGSGLA